MNTTQTAQPALDQPYRAFWTAVAEAATTALEELGDHPRAGEALFSTNAARMAAGLPPLLPR